MAWVYFLRSTQSNRLYIGSTTDLDRRIAQHRQGHTATTRRMDICTLVFSQEFPTLQEARYIEARLKKLKRKDYLERIILDGFIKVSLKAQPRRSDDVHPISSEVGAPTSDIVGASESVRAKDS